MPTTPQKAAGWRMEPPVSRAQGEGRFPGRHGRRRVPPEEPPGTRLGIPRVAGDMEGGVLGGGAHGELVHVRSCPAARRHQRSSSYSGGVVGGRESPPAFWRRRWWAGPARRCCPSPPWGCPPGAAAPPRGRGRHRQPPASARARSGQRVIKAPMSPSFASMASSHAWVNSRAETRPRTRASRVVGQGEFCQLFHGATLLTRTFGARPRIPGCGRERRPAALPGPWTARGRPPGTRFPWGSRGRSWAHPGCPGC